MSAPLDFYFDFASPYGYLASTQIDALAGRYGRTVAWRPIVLGAAFKETGARPLTQTPLKGPICCTTCRALPACSGYRLRCHR
jgi:2-hydroxychromene-2-carboxylate isomerase